VGQVGSQQVSSSRIQPALGPVRSPRLPPALRRGAFGNAILVNRQSLFGPETSGNPTVKSVGLGTRFFGEFC